jgi:hypothetical protein
VVGFLFLLSFAEKHFGKNLTFLADFSKKNETTRRLSNRPLFQEIVGCDGKVKKLKPGECEDICVDQTTYTNEYQVYRYKQKKLAKTPYLDFSSFFCTYHLQNPE